MSKQRAQRRGWLHEPVTWGGFYAWMAGYIVGNILWGVLT